MLKAIITGASGLVGSRVVELLQNFFEFIPLSHNECDITNGSAVEDKLTGTNFDVLLHLASYTQVDKAETEPMLVREINVTGTANLFNVCQKLQKKMIFISTDFVFDGTNPPYDETSTPHPLSVYAQTKHDAERLIANKGMVVRISYPYRQEFAKKLDFVRVIRKLLSEGKEVKMVNDSLITPTFIDDIAYGLKYLIENYTAKIFHLVGTEALSPYSAGQLIAKTYGFNPNLLLPITYKEYFAGKALRPRYMDIRSQTNDFYKMHSFSEGLQLIK